MSAEKDRDSLGRTIRAIAVQYYGGLTGKSIDEAKKSFDLIVSHNTPDPLLESALRLAEHEHIHG